MKKIFIILFSIAVVFIGCPAKATDRIIISEIQAYGQTATDEFVRLYNPTSLPINIGGWKLIKKTSGGTEYNLVSSFADGTTISANSGFLISHKTDYLGSESPQATYSGATYSFSINNTIIIKDGSGAIIDKVGFGTAVDFEGAPAQNPENGKSIRRANNQDTDNNAVDFPTTAPANTNTNEPANEPVPPPETHPLTNYGDVVINEIMPNPSEGKEWIELLNLTSSAINLSGWKISDGASVIYEPTGTIAPDGFFIAETNNRLNNTGDAVYLSDATGKSIFQLSYGNWPHAKWPAPEKGESLARDDDEKFYATSLPTKNFTNQFSKSVTTVIDSGNASNTSTITAIPVDPRLLSIVEILPNPEGADTELEYIKIFNNSLTDADIGGIYLDDIDGGSTPHKIPVGTIIKAKGELIFYSSKTNISLNNATDSARILDYDKKEIQKIEYEDAPEGSVYIFQNGKWGWENTKTTKKENNETSTETGLPRSARNDKQNSITATVIASPGILGPQIMYVDGLQLYMYSKDWPELSIGDKVYAFGTPSTYYGEPRLKLKDRNSIKIISKNNSVTPAELLPENIDDEYIGRLVLAEGEVLEAQSKKIFLDIDGTEILVYDKTGKNLFSDIEEADKISVIGVLNKYNDDFRILPRGKDDIRITDNTAKKQPLEKKTSIWYYAISSLFGGGIVFMARKRRAGWPSRNPGQPNT